MICPSGKSTTQHPSGTVVSNPCFGCHRAATHQATAYKGADTFESCQSKQENGKSESANGLLINRSISKMEFSGVNG
jgi:hypothetical protein